MRRCDASGDLPFPIASNPLYSFYAGYQPDGRQALVACWRNGKMVMVGFDRKGKLTGVVHEDLPTPRQLLEVVDLPAVYEDNYEEYLRRALNVSPGMIRIKAFALPEEQLAVYELPDFLQELQENPSDPKLSDDERKRLSEFLREWKARGQFVLQWGWGGDLWLDNTGEVVAS